MNAFESDFCLPGKYLPVANGRGDISANGG
jgi:hypothetical protein